MPYISKNIFFEDTEENRYIVKWDSINIWIEDTQTGGRLEVREHTDIKSCFVFSVCEGLNNI